MSQALILAEQEVDFGEVLQALQLPDTGDGEGWCLEWRKGERRLRSYASSRGMLTDLWSQRARLMVDPRYWTEFFP